MKEVKCVKECISKAKADFEKEGGTRQKEVTRDGKCIYRVWFNQTGFDLYHYDTLLLTLDTPYKEKTPYIGLDAYSRTDCTAINTALTWVGVEDKYEVHIKDGRMVLWTWI